jgi:hypothetical protein
MLEGFSEYGYTSHVLCQMRMIKKLFKTSQLVCCRMSWRQTSGIGRWRMPGHNNQYQLRLCVVATYIGNAWDLNGASQ